VLFHVLRRCSRNPEVVGQGTPLFHHQHPPPGMHFAHQPGSHPIPVPHQPALPPELAFQRQPMPHHPQSLPNSLYRESPLPPLFVQSPAQSPRPAHQAVPSAGVMTLDMVEASLKRPPQQQRSLNPQQFFQLATQYQQQGPPAPPPTFVSTSAPETSAIPSMAPMRSRKDIRRTQRLLKENDMVSLH
jgi:hypothetical protein